MSLAEDIIVHMTSFLTLSYVQLPCGQIFALFRTVNEIAD